MTARSSREVEIRGTMIRLGQLLKLGGVVDSGAQAKLLLAEGRVAVNGVRETRRGRQLHDGDRISIGDEVLNVSVGGG